MHSQGRSAHVALDQQGFQGQQKVKIQTAKAIHEMHSAPANNRFPLPGRMLKDDFVPFAGVDQ
jgi:hypothetical protein